MTEATSWEQPVSQTRPTVASPASGEPDEGCTGDAVITAWSPVTLSVNSTREVRPERSLPRAREKAGPDSSAGAAITKALILADQHKFPEAESFLQQAIDIQQKCASTPQFKSDYTVYNTLGWVQLVRGDQRKAEESFKAALAHAGELTPASVARTKSNLGYLYFSNGEFAKAQPFLKDAADAGNKNAVTTLTALDQAQKIYKSTAVPAK